MSVEPSHEQNALQLYSIGAKLRTLRVAKGLTLTRLAAEVGLSTALLSKLETDRMLPTLATLWRICQVYGIGLSYFFSEPTQHLVAITRNVQRAADGRAHPTIQRTALHAPTAHSKQLSQIISIPAGVTTTLVDTGSPSALTAYVLDGLVRFSIAGITEELQAGDCVVLETDAIVMWSAADCACRLLAVFAKCAPGHAPNKRP